MSAITKAIGDQTARNLFSGRTKTTTVVLTEAELSTVIEATVVHTLEMAAKVVEKRSADAANDLRELFR